MTASNSLQGTAILCIDPYNEFLHKDGKLYSSLEESLNATGTIGHMKEVLVAARAQHVPVFFCMHQQHTEQSYHGWERMTVMQKSGHNIKVFEEGSFGAKFFEGLEPDFKNGDVVVSKHWNSSSFANTDLNYQLIQRGITKVIMVGLVANSCMEATGRFAYELGYDVTMISDATAGFTQELKTVATDLVWPHTFARTVISSKDWIASLPKA